MILSSILSKATKPLVKGVSYHFFQQRNGHFNLPDIMRSLDASQYYSPEQLHDIQMERLKRILAVAYEQTPFYRERFDASGFHPDNFKDADDLKKIPPLTKNDIRRDLSKMLSPLCKDKNTCVSSISGGTTGPSIELYNSKSALTRKFASQLRFDSWAGWAAGEWTSIIWPAVVDMHHNPPTVKDWLKNYLSIRSISLQQAVIEEDDFARHFNAFKGKNPTMLRGFPFQVNQAARYSRENGLKFPHLKGIITTGEPLLPGQRDLIEQAFQSPVYDSYRAREVGCIAQECSEHNGMHISAELLYVEIDHTENETAQEGEGRILVTDLVNDAMPFIRYEIGDIGTLATGTCACGRGLPLLQSIGGRTSDQLFTPDGRLVSPVTIIPNLFHLIGILNQFRIIQDRLDHLIIQMVKPAPDEDKLKMQRAAAERIFGQAMKITYEYVDRIQPVASGKYPFIISKISTTEQSSI